ncbi:MAG: hypothetical protein NC203_08850 [Firmicutes bacterium]|nr:hypothetical protein [[Eubacterium] siraeum]MCM1488461.1 hypothetical protein [Bacillota bacterium]
MSNNRKSSLFLMELMIALLIFAVCAGVCAAIIAKAAVSISESRDISNALIIAQNNAEMIKNGIESENKTYYYDSDLTIQEKSDSTVYFADLKISAEANGVIEYTVEVFRTTDSKLIYTIDSAYYD